MLINSEISVAKHPLLLCIVSQIHTGERKILESKQDQDFDTYPFLY
jgi:hypothetical protein